MQDIKISLCIPTMDRFDKFLNNYLETYTKYLSQGIIHEIIICDENGNDYEKIKKIYNNDTTENPIKIYKNNTILGVFKNKLKVTSYASPNHFVALIDSDNFADETYFDIAKKYIYDKKLTINDPFTLAPTKCIPRFEFSFFKDMILDGPSAGHYIDHNIFQTMLNTSNYIVTPIVFSNIYYDDELVERYRTYDTTFIHLLAFQQIPEYRIHCVRDLNYYHSTHDESYFLNNHQYCDEYFNTEIIPLFKQLI